MRTIKIFNSFIGVENSVNDYKWLYLIIISACLLPFISPAIALFIGLVLSFAGLRHENIQKYTSKTASIHCFNGVWNEYECRNFSFKVEKNIALLIATGTAICGGSAIAAVAPILKSKNYQTSFALIVVFVLNALALFLFPFIGHQLGLSQETFGNWAAIAIHDTSSVVGAGASYGDKALQIATTVKLIRALWIIPLSIIIAFMNKSGEKKAISFPWFILLFVLALVFANIFPQFQTSYQHFDWLGKRGMVIALFLIGSNISVNEIKKSGAKSFALGITLWAVIALGSLFFIAR